MGDGAIQGERRKAKGIRRVTAPSPNLLAARSDHFQQRINRIGFKSPCAAQLNPGRGMVARFFLRAVLHVDCAQTFGTGPRAATRFATSPVTRINAERSASSTSRWPSYSAMLRLRLSSCSSGIVFSNQKNTLARQYLGEERVPGRAAALEFLECVERGANLAAEALLGWGKAGIDLF